MMKLMISMLLDRGWLWPELELELELGLGLGLAIQGASSLFCCTHSLRSSVGAQGGQDLKVEDLDLSIARCSWHIVDILVGAYSFYVDFRRIETTGIHLHNSKSSPTPPAQSQSVQQNPTQDSRHSSMYATTTLNLPRYPVDSTQTPCQRFSLPNYQPYPWLWCQYSIQHPQVQSDSRP